MYDYLIAGAGAAGLSLAYKISQNPILKDKTILIIDKEAKNQNDRTWCFWHKQPSMFAPIIAKSWEHIWFQSPRFSQKIPLNPYQYSMIKGIDFYDFTQEKLQQNPRIDWVQGEVAYFSETPTEATVHLKDGQVFSGKWAFNSALRIFPHLTKGYHYFWQHFKGWVVRAEKPIFDAQSATFMDFRVEQHGQARFFYLLPTSAYESLVEFTIFSEELLQDHEYDFELKAYFEKHWAEVDFEILEIEQGKIPMFDAPFPQNLGARVVNVGVAGGKAKASSGYAFQNIQQETDNLLTSLAKFNNPFQVPMPKRRFRFYDSMLLNVMKYQRRELRDIFAILFQKHPIERVLKFLDEKTNFTEELLIMGMMPPSPFLKALPKVMQQEDLLFSRTKK